MKKFIDWLITETMMLIIELAATLLVSTYIGEALVEFAYKERGYRAVGGEWLLIIFIAVSVFFLTRNVLKLMMKGGEDDRRGKNTGRKASGRSDNANTVRGSAGKSRTEAGENYQPRG